eukprot:Gb_21246 [translate_table: standard]
MAMERCNQLLTTGGTPNFVYDGNERDNVVGEECTSIEDTINERRSSSSSRQILVCSVCLSIASVGASGVCTDATEGKEVNTMEVATEKNPTVLVPNEAVEPQEEDEDTKRSKRLDAPKERNRVRQEAQQSKRAAESKQIKQRKQEIAQQSSNTQRSKVGMSDTNYREGGKILKTPLKIVS